MGPLLIETLRGNAPRVGGPLVRRPATETPAAAIVRLARGGRRRTPRETVVVPVLGEEEAATLLYGERSGTVVASPSRPPVY
jgi:hypothetical protein